MVAELIKRLRANAAPRVLVTAPTHKALAVLGDKLGHTDCELMTTQAALGLKLIEMDSGDQRLQKDSKPKIEQYELVVVDEASMLHPDIFAATLASRMRARILFVGDPAQLAPVGSDEPSLAFSDIVTLTADQWGAVRAEREVGATFASLAAKFGVSHQAIQKRAKKEVWGDGSDVGEAVRKKVAEKVANVVAGCNPKKKAEAIDAAASRAAAVVEMHRAEWAEHREAFGSVAKDFDEGKHAKISAEMLTIRQRGERIAHGLDDMDTRPVITIERSYTK